MPSMRMPAPQRAARTAAATDTAALRTGTGSRRQATSAGSPSSSPRSSPRSIATSRGSSALKRSTESAWLEAGRLEVQWQGARGHAESDTTAVTSLEPGDLLSNERRGPEWKQERCRRGPPRRVLRQDEGRHLQRLRHVSGKATVVLAGHDPVEPVAEGETGLRAELADYLVGGKFIVRVQPDGHRSGTEWSGPPYRRGRIRTPPRGSRTALAGSHHAI